MSKLEKTIFWFAVISITFVFLSYMLKFYNFNISGNTSDWGTFGDYVGGILSPILSFLIIILIINEAKHNRDSLNERREFEFISQEQINKQIEILSPKPDLVYFVSSVNSSVFATIENIGNAVAYDINISFEFEDKVSIDLEKLERLSKLSYITPKNKHGIFLSQININHDVIGITPHTVTIVYKADLVLGNEIRKVFYVDNNMLGSIYNSNELSSGLRSISNELSRMNNKGRLRL